jgi:DUF1365 family protein
VSPTTKPTKKPAKTKAKSCMVVTIGKSLYISKYFVVRLLYDFMHIKRPASELNYKISFNSRFSILFK